ncbi:O-antigen ligase family protein [Streptomyces sp.]|uniref:O-antigen ligase family protein n=1 Tax=Streptomyces sp. TaxID=1931 RepID=UPI002D78BDEF|nr:O-antigen ligase family protein [Streptomyces sp.]HET6359358.1 O-antigen ligase family protein [Streptomyces sp.]
MRALSRGATPILIGTTASVALIGHFAGPRWPVVTVLTALAALLVAFLPPAVLLAGAIVTGHGLGVAALQAPLAGPLMLSDVLLLLCLLRCLTHWRTEQAERHRFVSVCLLLFLAWSILATVHAGTSVTALLRIAAYGGVFLLLSRRGTDRKLIYGTVTCYALVSVVGGVLQGQTRLVGLDIGDPAQTGALLLAALCPLLTSELRGSWTWLVGAVLLYGIFLTQTRSVWFATIVVLVVWAQKRLTLSRLVALFAGLALVGLQTVNWITHEFGLNTFSAAYRWQSIVAGMRSGLENPVFGSGWGYASSTYGASAHLYDAVRQVSPYNLFVCVFASVGLPAVLLLVLFLGRLLHRLVSTRDAPLLFIVAVLAMSMTEMTLYAGSMLTLLFFTYAGMGLAPAVGGLRPSQGLREGEHLPPYREGRVLHGKVLPAGLRTRAVGAVGRGIEVTRIRSTRNQQAVLSASMHNEPHAKASAMRSGPTQS